VTAHLKQQRQRVHFTNDEIDSMVGVLAEEQMALLREAATGKNYKEIGLRLNIPRMIVSGKLNKARTAISQALAQREVEHG